MISDDFVLLIPIPYLDLFIVSSLLSTVHQCNRTLLFTWIMVTIGLIVHLYTKGSLTEPSLKRVLRKYTETCTKKLLALLQTKKHTPNNSSPGNAQYAVFVFVVRSIFM